MLLLLGREALIQLVEVAFVEDIIALNAGLLAYIVFELVIGVVMFGITAGFILR